MKPIRSAARLLAITLLAAATPVAHSAARAAIDPELLAARERAWRAYFAGDVKTLGDLLPPEFIGIGMEDGPFADRATTLDGARGFRERGGKLVRLAFPETRQQQFGDAVVLYGRYEVVLHTSGGERTMRGRLTEIFVRRGGKWVHPGWHLDLAAPPQP